MTGPKSLFKGVRCSNTIFVRFLSGSFLVLLAYVSWGTTCMSFWQRTVVETARRGTRELAQGHHGRGQQGLQLAPCPVATPPTAARAAGDPEFLLEPPAHRAARGPRVSPLWGPSPHASWVRGGECCARHLSLSPGPSPGLLGATLGWRGWARPPRGDRHSQAGPYRGPANTCCPRPLRALISDGGTPASGPRGGVFWKMTDREPMGWAGSKASPNDQQAGAGQNAEPGTG